MVDITSISAAELVAELQRGIASPEGLPPDLKLRIPVERATLKRIDRVNARSWMISFNPQSSRASKTTVSDTPVTELKPPLEVWQAREMLDFYRGY